MTAASLAYDMRADEAAACVPERPTARCVLVRVLPAPCSFPEAAEGWLAPAEDEPVLPAPDAADPAARRCVSAGRRRERQRFAIERHDRLSGHPHGGLVRGARVPHVAVTGDQRAQERERGDGAAAVQRARDQRPPRAAPEPPMPSTARLTVPPARSGTRRRGSDDGGDTRSPGSSVIRRARAPRARHRCHRYRSRRPRRQS